ncbi:MAG: response regulator [Planctomycetota bacterium]
MSTQPETPAKSPDSGTPEVPDEHVLRLPDRILIVDDDPATRLRLRKTLKTAKHVIEAENGKDGLEKMHKQRPDFIVTDLQMPEMNGLELLKCARSSPSGAAIPIMVLTADEDPKVLLEVFNNGADDFLVKPFKMSELRIRVAAIHMRQQLARDVNPLTRLPGNSALKKAIADRLRDPEADMAVAYFDLDHFKEFNDTQGFDRGDHVISLLGDLLRYYASTRPPGEAYIGHVGGDDFVMLLDEDEIEAMAEVVHIGFESAVEGLYTPEEVAKGYVKAKNRRGEEENIPLLSVSIGVVLTASRKGMRDIRRISHVAAEVKKMAKGIPGNSLFIDRRKYAPEDKPAFEVERSEQRSSD